MTKQAFIDGLRRGLSGMPGGDIEERITFYGEMIDDRVEEGLSEDEAVAQIGDVDSVISQIKSEIPLTHIVKERIKPKRELKGWEIALIAIGSPVWLPLLIAVFAVLLSVFIVLVALAVSFWSVAISLIAGGIAAVLWSVFYLFVYAGASAVNAVCYCGVGLAAIGLGILAVFGCRLFDRGLAAVTKKMIGWLKNVFTGRRNRV